jgi:rod shape determining protein RodA
VRIDYNIKDKFDFGLIIPTVFLFGFGLLAIFSATVNNPLAQGNFQKQVLFGVFALVIFFITYSVPTKTFKAIAFSSYFVSILLLIAVLLIGRQISGSKSWLAFGAIGFQPSELAKITTILLLASYLSKDSTDIDSFKDILIALAIGFFPVALILLEPDLGTAIVFIGMILSVIFWKGISTFALFVVLSPAAVAVASLFGIIYFVAALLIILVILFLFKKNLFLNGSLFALNLAAGFFADYVFHALKPHQQQRIQAFIDPTTDPLGSGYNTIQAQVAIGSGGLTGKGFLAGNQTQLQFIPEQWTDFIYCVIGEEFGFIGSVFILILFAFLFLRILKISFSTKDEFLSLVTFGILSVYFIHFTINLGMVVGILPVIGIPLPFVSYGGSSLVVNMFMLGIVANIFRTRKNFT